MYRGLATLVGMEVLETGESLKDEVETLKRSFADYDFFYIHFKKTDAAGEDGNFKKKVKALEEIDRVIPSILRLKPDVLVVTGDHSTPSVLKSHSWHPNPILLYSNYVRPDRIRRFTERELSEGPTGQISGKVYSSFDAGEWTEIEEVRRMKRQICLSQSSQRSVSLRVESLRFSLISLSGNQTEDILSLNSVDSSEAGER